MRRHSSRDLTGILKYSNCANSSDISFTMSQARLHNHLNKRPRAFTTPTRVTAVRRNSVRSPDGDDVFSRE